MEDLSFLFSQQKAEKTTLEFEYATKNISLTKQKKLTEEEKKKDSQERNTLRRHGHVIMPRRRTTAIKQEKYSTYGDQ